MQLTEEIQRLEYWSSFWNWARFWLTAITAVVTVAAYYIASNYSDRLADARKRETQLKEEQRARESEEATKQIEAAKASAAEANERAQQNELAAEEIRQQNLKLGLQLESEKQRRLEIERRLAPRFFTPRELETIGNSIRSFGGHPVFIGKLLDAEAAKYSDQIIAAFNAAKWKISVRTDGMRSPPIYGVAINISADPDLAVRTAISALEKAGVNFELHKNQKAPAEVLEIIIGLRAPP